ncbi:hypothetical protein ABGF26_00365 [Helcococcus ovis]
MNQRILLLIIITSALANISILTAILAMKKNKKDREKEKKDD